MKILVTATDAGEDAAIDRRFGRAKKFALYDTEAEKYEFIDNEKNANVISGAGTGAAQAAVDTGADVVLTGHCGPRAFAVLNAAGITVYTGVQGAVKEAIDQYENGAFTTASAGAGRHWG